MLFFCHKTRGPIIIIRNIKEERTVAFKTTANDFEKVFGAEKTMTEQFMDKLKEYLETRKMVTPYKEIYERILTGKPLSSFGCRYDIANDMTEMFGENGIPCIRVLAPNGKVGFITSSDDDDAVQDLQAQLKKMLGRYMPVFTGKQLRALIDGKKRMSVLSISGLTEEEAMVMRDQCAKETEISAVGIDKMNDGTYKFSVFSDEAIKKGQKGLTLAQIYIRTKLMLRGPYRDVMALRAARQARFEELVAMNFDVDTANNGNPVTLIGEGNEYMRLSAEGMQYGHYEMRDGNPVYLESNSAMAVMPNYPALVASYSSRLVNPTIVYDIHGLSKALTSPSLAMSNSEIHDSMAGKAAMSYIAGLLDSKKEYDPVLTQPGAFDQKFSRMVDKSTALLMASVNSEFPREYSEKEKAGFKTMLSQNGVNMEPYMGVLTGLKATEVRIERKDIELISDISKYTGEREQGQKSPSREDLGLS